jgi:hypothetical protein
MITEHELLDSGHPSDLDGPDEPDGPDGPGGPDGCDGPDRIDLIEAARQLVGLQPVAQVSSAGAS